MTRKKRGEAKISPKGINIQSCSKTAGEHIEKVILGPTFYRQRKHGLVYKARELVIRVHGSPQKSLGKVYNFLPKNFYLSTQS